MSAANSLNRDDRKAIRAFLRCADHRRAFFLSSQFVDIANNKKYCKGHNQKADDCIHEYAIVDRNCTGSLGGSGCQCIYKREVQERTEREFNTDRISL